MITPELLKKVKAKIATNRASYEHFFNSINDPAWIEPLLKEGFFKKPTEAVREGQYISFPPWPEIGFLLRVVDKDPAKVVLALNVMESTDNQQVMEVYTQILLKLDSDKSVRFAQKVIDFLETPFQLRIPGLSADLAVKLVKDRHVAAGIRILNSLLEVKPDPKASELKGDALHWAMIKPQIKYRDYDYEQILETVVPVLSDEVPLEATRLFSALLEKTIEYKMMGRSQPTNDDAGPWEDYSSMWRPDITVERHSYHDQPRQGLVSALRDSLTGLLKSSLTEKEKLDFSKEIAAKNYRVFSRIVEYVLREYKDVLTFKEFYDELFKTVKPIIDSSFLIQNAPIFTEEHIVSIAELADLSNEELLEKIKRHTPDPRHIGPWRDDLADALTALIKDDPRRYIQLTDQFKGLKSEYINSLLSAAKEKADDLTEAEIASVLRLGLTLFSAIGAPEESRYSNWARMSLAHFVTKILGQREDKSEYISEESASLVFETLQKLLKDPDPTPEQEKQYGGSNMDPATLSLNTVRGEAMHAVGHFIIWLRRNKLDDKFIKQTYAELDWHLDTKNDPSLAIRSVYGKWFPWIWAANKPWAQENLLKIFSEDEHGEAAWDSYVSFNQAFTDVLVVMEPVIKREIGRLIEDAPERKGVLREAENQFVHHLMIYYWNGILALEEGGLIRFFFGTANAAYRAEAISFIGIQLRRLEEKLEDKIIERLKELWKYRLEIAVPAELEEFGDWFASTAFDDRWALDNLQSALAISHNANPDFLVLEKLATLSDKYPLEAVHSLAEMITGARERWSITSWEGNAMTIISNAYKSADAEAKRVAIDQANKLVAKGYYSFRNAIKD